MNSTDIRKTFLDFFAARGHAVRRSDGLIPASDPTLLFTSAGMVQFKNLWLTAPLEFNRAATVQKCLRVGGKQSDLENVGRTLRHHSFFEMLGNFSFGDYFKEEAIAWAWEFVTGVMGLEKGNLWVSVFLDDDEAALIWEKKMGLAPGRIIRLGEKDNFWGPAGSSGPCGPCSEIYFDRGLSYGCGGRDCRPGCDCERFFEFWNLVFPQFYQEPDGSRRLLPRRGIDTGMGLERLALLKQGGKSSYETDLFRPLVEETQKMAAVSYTEDSATPYHVIVDHVRALTFAVSENILPSNEGRGYVVRRLLRRASRFGRKIGLERSFLHDLVPAVVEAMSGAYPELLETREHVRRVVRAEEERFRETLTLGLEKLDEIASSLKKQGKILIPGGEVFKLYDTYGFPPELTDEVAQEKALSVDWKGFEEEMEKQRERGRKAWKGVAAREVMPVYLEVKESVGDVESMAWSATASRSRVAALISGGKRIEKVSKPGQLEVILDRTPFYAEAGGQVGDTGLIESREGRIEVSDTVSPVEGLVIHQGNLVSGRLGEGEEVRALVDQEKRAAIQRHHTATHLLQRSLRETLGEHVTQAGSFVGPDYFRFDFTHYQGLTGEELNLVELKVNELIRADDPVEIFNLPISEAKKMGALAFFGEKYGDTVRMIDVGGYSRELCGGTHVRRTGEIGLFLIVSESSVASGVRRIEALCGDKALKRVFRQREILERSARILKTSPERVPERLEKAEERIRALENEKSFLLQNHAAADLDALIEAAAEVEGVRVVAANLGRVDVEELRVLADSLRRKMVSGIGVLGSIFGERVCLVTVITPDLVAQGRHAGRIVKEISRLLGGGGGGRADLAQGGGKDIQSLDAVLADLPRVIKETGPAV